MCLTPIHLRTNAKYISLNGYKRFYVDVPCGKCSECQQMKKNEWYLRNYYESQLTWSNNGYILFDTLTYDDVHLPSVSKTILGFDINDTSVPMSFLKVFDWLIENNLAQDNDLDCLRRTIKYFRENNFSCFCYHDVQNFLKLLRIRLERAGFDVKKNLRYFISSEYGHEDNYIDSRGHNRKGTARPHYHVLFYVNDPNIDPITLSQYISDAWIYGRTDGYVYRGRAYVYNNAFGPKFIKDPNRLTGVQYYVSKYVCKDYEFSDQVDVRISKVLNHIFLCNFSDSDYRDRKRTLHRYMDQFHRQSLGFGLNAIFSENNLDTIWKRSSLVVPDKEKVSKSFPIPMYYIRKLFQKCVKDSEGTLHWVWTDLGKEWKKLHLNRTIDTLATKMQDWYNNLGTYLQGSTFFDDVSDFRERIDNLLEGRSWRDYAVYVLFYKGRVSRDRFDPEDLETIVNNSLDDDFSSGDYMIEQTPGVYKYQDFYFDDYEFRNGCIMSDDCLGDAFVGFDRLSQLYTISMINWNKKKQEAYNRKLELQKSLKALGFKSKKRL